VTDRRRLLIDLAGKRFGRLVVRAYAGSKKWSCACDCGARVIVRGAQLRKGKTRSCGCLRTESRPKWIDLTGQRFGCWIVTAYAGHRRWFCVCDCGTRADVLGQSLRRGDSRSSGCLTTELRAKHTRIDLVGKRFGRWRVIAPAGGVMWSCVCTCGTCRDINGQSLREGRSKSCGCLKRELAKSRMTTHGMCGTREYNSWQSMIARCCNPRHTSYKNYGERGVGVHEAWRLFVNWFADMGSRPPSCSQDRIDVNGSYVPSDLRWADAKQQANNRRPRQASATTKRPQLVEPPPLDDPPF